MSARSEALRQLAAHFKISVRSIERASRVRRYGIPELVALVERGELALGPAEFLAQFPPEMQRGVIAYGGAPHVRKWVALNRRAFASEAAA